MIVLATLLDGHIGITTIGFRATGFLPRHHAAACRFVCRLHSLDGRGYRRGRRRWSSQYGDPTVRRRKPDIAPTGGTPHARSQACRFGAFGLAVDRRARMTDRTTLVARLIPFLLSRRYDPGDRVPSERELAERFKVSRGQIREALSFLEALRIIERRAKSGVYMAAQDSSVEALALFARLGIPLTPADVRQTVEMRRIHEIAAIRLACERRTEANVTRLREILAGEARHVAAGESMAEDDRLFHGEILRATQNGVFVRVANVFTIMTATQRVLYFRDPRRGQESHEQHLSMFAAIERSDAAGAGDLMDAHLQGVDSDWQLRVESGGGRLALSAEADG
jgi:DNA-binding FadR family transcriptional regulator